jgi:dihydrolipoamide dehydrogenase
LNDECVNIEQDLYSINNKRDKYILTTLELSSSTVYINTEVLVLGSGPGGYTAAFRASDLGKKVVLVEQEKTLGGVCLNMGCIPTKSLLHAAKVITEAEEMAENGISFGAPVIDLERLREWKSKDVVTQLTTGLGNLAKQRQVTTIQGVGKFIAEHQLEVKSNDGIVTIVNFDYAIIAVGSHAIRIPGVADDPRIMDSTEACYRRRCYWFGNGYCL